MKIPIISLTKCLNTVNLIIIQGIKSGRRIILSGSLATKSGYFSSSTNAIIRNQRPNEQTCFVSMEFAETNVQLRAFMDCIVLDVIRFGRFG